MRHSGRRAYLAILAGSLSILAAACGSSSSSGGPSSGSSGGQASTSTSTAPGSGSASAAGTTPAAGGSQPTSPHAAGPAPCATTDMQVKLGASSGAAGSVYQTIDFTNNSTTTCTLYGYPGVSLTGGSPPGQIGAAAVRNPSPGPRQISLAPGAVANAVVQVTFAGNYPAATCGLTPADALLVYPPNQKASVSLPYHTSGCSSTKITILHVSVVQSGAG